MLRNTVPSERHSFYLLCHNIFQNHGSILAQKLSKRLFKCQSPWLVEIVSCLFSNDLAWIESTLDRLLFHQLVVWRKFFLLDKVHSTNLERFTWLFICGMNWLFCGTNWLFHGTIWLLIGTIWLGTMSTIWPWNKITGYRHAPSRLPMSKLKSLLQKTRKVTLSVWKSNRKSEIHCYVKNRKGLHFKRYRSNCNSVRFLLKGQLQNYFVNEERCICRLSINAQAI